MKVILSKKGLDSGCSTSPILITKDFKCQMPFIPIPEQDNEQKYNSVERFYKDNSLQDVLNNYIKNYDNAKFKFKNENKQIEKKSIKDCLNLGCHLDPQLEDYFGYGKDFRATFGQSGGAQSYLNNCGVGVGDLFLFYGWYYNENDKQEQNILFGYMKIGEILRFDNEGNVYLNGSKGDRENIENNHKYLEKQPHWVRLKNNPEKYNNDVIYIAEENGFGFFNYDKKLILTDTESKNKKEKPVSKTHWMVENLADCEVMRYKNKNGQNKKFHSDGSFLAPQGFCQELVIDCEKYSKARNWVNSLGNEK